MDLKQKTDEMFIHINDEFNASQVTNKYIRLRNTYVIMLCDYADTALRIQKAIEQHQTDIINKDQIAILKNQYDAIIKNKYLWYLLKQYGMECENTLHNAILTIHTKINNELGRRRQ